MQHFVRRNSTNGVIQSKHPEEPKKRLILWMQQLKKDLVSERVAQQVEQRTFNL